MDVSDVLREASVPEASNMNHIVTIMGACDDSIFLVFDLTYHQKLKLFGQQHFFRFFFSFSTNHPLFRCRLRSFFWPGLQVQALTATARTKNWMQLPQCSKARLIDDSIGIIGDYANQTNHYIG